MLEVLGTMTLETVKAVKAAKAVATVEAVKMTARAVETVETVETVKKMVKKAKTVKTVKTVKMPVKPLEPQRKLKLCEQCELFKRGEPCAPDLATIWRRRLRGLRLGRVNMTALCPQLIRVSFSWNSLGTRRKPFYNTSCSSLSTTQPTLPTRANM